MTLKLYASFSEAIREGAKLTPSGSPLQMMDRNGGTCALGAGAVAIGVDVEGEVYLELGNLYRYLNNKSSCPVCSDISRLDLTLACLFDSHKWTRESIADWLETEEEKLGFVTVCETEPVNKLSLGITIRGIPRRCFRITPKS